MTSLQPLSPGREKRRDRPPPGGTRFAVFNQNDKVDINAEKAEGSARGGGAAASQLAPRRADTAQPKKGGLRPGLSFSSVGVAFVDDLEDEDADGEAPPAPVVARGLPPQKAEKAPPAPSLFNGWGWGYKAWKRMC